MKLFTIVFGLLFFAGVTYCQEEQVYTKQELKAMQKAEKKAKRLAMEEVQRAETDTMLQSHRFVLEADYLSDGKGSRIPVTSNLNFIVLDSLEASIQLGTTTGIGYNGVGGITVDGRVSKYDLKVIEGKKGKSYTLMVVIMTSLGTYDITFMISSTGITDATVRGNTMGQLRYSGRLVPVGKSRVYKGRSI